MAGVSKRYIIIMQVFLPIDNDGHQFLMVFDIKYVSVMMFDQKKYDKNAKIPKLKKGAKIHNVTVAEMIVSTICRTNVLFKLEV